MEKEKVSVRNRKQKCPHFGVKFTLMDKLLSIYSLMKEELKLKARKIKLKRLLTFEGEGIEDFNFWGVEERAHEFKEYRNKMEYTLEDGT